MTGLLESAVRKLSFVWTHDRSVRSFSRLRKSPAGLAFKATEKLDPDVRELLSMHCSWCVLDCGEAQRTVRPARRSKHVARIPGGPHRGLYKCNPRRNWR